MGVREEKHARVLAAIEDAALRLFAEQGFDAVTVDAIAEAAGTSRATVFRYYGSKEAVLFANHPRELEVLQALLEAHPDARESVDGLRDVLRRFADALEAEGDALRLRARIVGGDDRLVTIALGTRGRWAGLVTAWLAAGEPPTVRHEVLGSLAVEALLLGVRRWQRSSDGTRLRAVVDSVFDEILGLADDPRP